MKLISKSIYKGIGKNDKPYHLMVLWYETPSGKKVKATAWLTEKLAKEINEELNK